MILSSQRLAPQNQRDVMSPERLDSELFTAALAHDTVAIDALVAQGANPFAPVGPVELFAPRSAWSTQLPIGCAAALSIQWPAVLERLLPKKMTQWPVVARAVDDFGLVSACGADIDLGHWAVEMCAMDSLELLIARLDRSHPNAQACLRQLTLSCLRGCSRLEARDGVLRALVLCMAAKPRLAQRWLDWQRFLLPSQTKDHQSLCMPMTFVMGMVASRKNTTWPPGRGALAALAWALAHDKGVREGHTRMGTVSRDTIVHMAVASAEMDVLLVLLHAGCSLVAIDAEGLTALEFAKKYDRFEAAACIESWLAARAISDIFPNNSQASSDQRV